MPEQHASNNDNEQYTTSESPTSLPTVRTQSASAAGQPETETETETERITVEQLVVMLNAEPTKSAKIRLLNSLGYPRGDIAKLLQITYQHVYNVLNIAATKADDTNVNASQRGEVQRKILSSYERTKSVTATARELERPYQQVYQVLLRQGKIVKGQRSGGNGETKPLEPIDLMARLRKSYNETQATTPKRDERRNGPVQVSASAFSIEDLTPFEQGLTHHPDCRCADCKQRDEAILKELEEATSK